MPATAEAPLEARGITPVVEPDVAPTAVSSEPTGRAIPIQRPPSPKLQELAQDLLHPTQGVAIAQEPVQPPPVASGSFAEQGQIALSQTLANEARQSSLSRKATTEQIQRTATSQPAPWSQAERPPISPADKDAMVVAAGYAELKHADGAYVAEANQAREAGKQRVRTAALSFAPHEKDELLAAAQAAEPRLAEQRAAEAVRAEQAKLNQLAETRRILTEAGQAAGQALSDRVPASQPEPQPVFDVDEMQEQEYLARHPKVGRIVGFIRSLKREFVDELDTARIVQRYQVGVKPSADGNEAELTIYRLNPDGSTVAGPHLEIDELRAGLTTEQNTTLTALIEGKPVEFPAETVSRISERIQPGAEPRYAAESEERFDAITLKIAQAFSERSSQQQEGWRTAEKQIVAAAVEGHADTAVVIKEARTALADGQRSHHEAIAQATTDAGRASNEAATALVAAGFTPTESHALVDDDAEAVVPRITKRSTALGTVLGTLASKLGGFMSGRRAAVSGSNSEAQGRAA